MSNLEKSHDLPDEVIIQEDLNNAKVQVDVAIQAAEVSESNKTLSKAIWRLIKDLYPKIADLEDRIGALPEDHKKQFSDQLAKIEEEFGEVAPKYPREDIV